MVRQLSIDQFENEGRRVSYGTPESATAARKLLDQQMSINSVPKKVIAHLLKPRHWKPPVRRQFFLDCNEIEDLCDSDSKKGGGHVAIPTSLNRPKKLQPTSQTSRHRNQPNHTLARAATGHLNPVWYTLNFYSHYSIHFQSHILQ